MFGREVGGRISWIEVVMVDFEDERPGIAWLEGIAEMAAADPILPFPGFKERYCSRVITALGLNFSFRKYQIRRRVSFCL